MITITMPLWIYILTIVLLFLVLIVIFTAIIMGMVIEQKQKKAIEKTYSGETEQDLIDDLRENMKSQQILFKQLMKKELDEKTTDGEKIVLTRIEKEKK